MVNAELQEAISIAEATMSADALMLALDTFVDELVAETLPSAVRVAVEVDTYTAS